jgi:hypothetical protein
MPGIVPTQPRRDGRIFGGATYSQIHRISDSAVGSEAVSAQRQNTATAARKSTARLSDAQGGIATCQRAEGSPVVARPQAQSGQTWTAWWRI